MGNAQGTGLARRATGTAGLALIAAGCFNLLGEASSSFDDSIAGWQPAGNVTLAHNPKAGCEALGALRIQVDPSGPYQDGTRTARASTLVGPRGVAVEPGQRMHGGFVIRPAGAPSPVRCELRFYDGDRILETRAGSNVLEREGAWVAVACEAVAPAGADRVALRAFIDRADYGDAHDLDEAWLGPSAAPARACAESPPSPDPVPDPDPAPDPDPVPTQQGVCTGRTATGGVPADRWPGAACTGVPAGTALRTMGTSQGRSYYVITQDGVTLDGVDFNSGLCVSANNVTIKRSRIRGAVGLDGAGYCFDGQRPRGLTLEDVEIDGQNSPWDAIPYGQDVTCLRCNIHDTSKGISGGDFQLIDSYIHDLFGEGTDPATYSHNEPVLITGGNVVMRHNNLQGFFSKSSTGGGMSASVALYTHGIWGPMDDVLLEGNLIDASAVYCTYGGLSDDNVPTNIRFIANTWVSPGACDAPITAWSRGGGNVWRDNRWSDGRVIPEP